MTDGPVRTVEETFYLVEVSGTDADVVQEEVGGIIEFVANRDDSDVTTSTTGPFTRTVDVDDELVESPSGWVFRESQENGDFVSCRNCGNNLNDDNPIYSNKEGFAFCSEECILADHDHDEELHPFEGRSDPDRSWACKTCGDTAEGLMHNNTERNIEPLLWEGE